MHEHDINTDDINKDVFECIFKALIIFIYMTSWQATYLFSLESIFQN